MLLFSSPFATTDYLRATGTQGTVGQCRVDALRELAQSWIASGVQAATLDRCPRCPEFLSIALAGLANWTKEDFAKIWVRHRATRLVLGELRVRSALDHVAKGTHAAARSDLEYARDHFDCGIPYLHQMIGLLAGLEGDESGKAVCVERLKEFGAEFECSLDFSPELLVKAMTGLMLNFGMVPHTAGPK